MSRRWKYRQCRSVHSIIGAIANRRERGAGLWALRIMTFKWRRTLGRASGPFDLGTRAAQVSEPRRARDSAAVLEGGPAKLYIIGMTKSLERAIAEMANLPEADQEQIGRRLLSHVEKLRRLRAEIDKGIRSLDAGEGQPLDVEDLLRKMNERHGRG